MQDSSGLATAGVQCASAGREAGCAHRRGRAAESLRASTKCWTFPRSAGRSTADVAGSAAAAHTADDRVFEQAGAAATATEDAEAADREYSRAGARPLEVRVWVEERGRVGIQPLGVEATTTLIISPAAAGLSRRTCRQIPIAAAVMLGTSWGGCFRETAGCVHS